MSKNSVFQVADARYTPTQENPDMTNSESGTTSERCSFVAEIYRRNVRGEGTVLTKYNNTHFFKVDVRDKPVDKRLITFNHNDYPYLKVALVDTYLDELS